MLRRLHFNLWYFARPPWNSGISPPELLDFIANHPAGRAIDLGCGTGTNVITLAQKGWQVTGVDFAPRAIQIARRKIREARVSAGLEVGDVTNLKAIAGPFDLVFDLGCFHTLRNRAAYGAELVRILARGGYWLMYGFINSTPNRSGPGIGEGDLNPIEARGLRLISRADGMDRRDRPSAWFLYQRA